MSGAFWAFGLLIVSAQPSWDTQLQEPFDLSRSVEWLVLDPDNHDVEEMIALRRQGVKLICRANIGTFEDWRKDTAAFPTKVLAPPQADWEGKRILDTQELDLLMPLTPEHNLAYVRALSEVARVLNLSTGHKNAPELAERLAASMDFMVVDGCFRCEWCVATAPYFKAGKPVFGMESIEDEIDWVQACAQAEVLGILMILKSDALDMSRLVCGETS